MTKQEVDRQRLHRLLSLTVDVSTLQMAQGRRVDAKRTMLRARPHVEHYVALCRALVSA